MPHGTPRKIGILTRSLPLALLGLGMTAPLRAKDLAITHVTIIDVKTGARVPDQTVTISGDRIVSVTPSSNTTPGQSTRLIDAKGKFVIPGLWDMHAHVFAFTR